MDLDLYNGNVLDPVHGSIRLSDIEKWFLYQKQFSRLRFIRQNTFVYYVFPSANHTRFEHSIGVMHLASEIFKNLYLNFKAGEYRRKKHGISRKHEGFVFLDIEKEYEQTDKNQKPLHLQELRLAALLHDIGHGPLSHKFDSFTINKKLFLEIVSSDNLSKKYLSAFENLLGKLKNEDRIKHEHISCLFVLQLVNLIKEEHKEKKDKFIGGLGKMIEALSAERIVRLIEPKLDFGNLGRMIVGNIDFSPLYSTIISSFPIDADRMDYLLRDGTFTGVKYGVYDISRLINSFVPVNVDGIGFLAIKESGIDACVRFIESRTHLFNIVYPHKTNLSASAMLDFIFSTFTDSVIQANSYDELVDFYWNNSDEHFLRTTIAEIVLPKTTYGEIRKKKEKTLDELLRRRLWKKIFIKRFTIKASTNRQKKYLKVSKALNKITSSINEIFETNNIYARASLFINNIFKDVENSNLKILSKISGDYKLINNWRKLGNEEVNTMDYQVGFFYIFMARDFDSSDEFKVKSKEILDLIDDKIKMLENLETKVPKSARIKFS